MKDDYNKITDRTGIIFVLFKIVLLEVATFLILLIISPHSKALVPFLTGFALIVLLIVLLVVYINYVVSLYQFIRNNKK